MDWFDTHCHLDRIGDPPVAPAAAEVLAAARAEGVTRFLVPGVTGVPTAAAALAATEAGVRYTVGVHPRYLAAAPDLDATLAAMRTALRDDPRCVGIGEIGLDFWDRPSEAERRRQRDALAAQLALAEEVGCPVVVHLRKGWKEFLTVAEAHAGLPWVMHMFSGAPDYAAALCKRLPRVWFGFGGPAARANARKPVAVLRSVGPDRILLETDAPDLTPPGLPRPNRPAYLPWIGARLARRLETTPAELAARTTANAAAVFDWRE